MGLGKSRGSQLSKQLKEGWYLAGNLFKTHKT